MSIPGNEPLDPVALQRLDDALAEAHAAHEKLMTEDLPDFHKAIGGLASWATVLERVLSLTQQILAMTTPVPGTATAETASEVSACKGDVCMIQKALGLLPGLQTKLPGLLAKLGTIGQTGA